MQRAVMADCGFTSGWGVLVNHSAFSANKGGLARSWPLVRSEAIRPHVLGRCAKLLEGGRTASAMLFFSKTSNARSATPARDSTAIAGLKEISRAKSWSCITLG